MNKELFIGLISGTSMDAVDCVLVEITQDIPKLVQSFSKPLPTILKSRLSELCSNRDVDLRVLGSTDIAVAKLFADTATEFLAELKLSPSQITAIGSHGQTIWHEPPQTAQGDAFTIQLGDPNTIAEICGITTVADFRRSDMAAGGQGAPIVPVLHQALFQTSKTDRIVLNLGGIANITYLPKSGDSPQGLDTGPASVLMDGWICRHQQLDFDDAGQWAASSHFDQDLLDLLLDDSYFRLPSPKSTGRELFNLNWLDQKLANHSQQKSANCIQATLLELTSETISREILKFTQAGEILVCGGGSKNSALLKRLRERLPDFTLCLTTDYGLDADFVEATAFAWFASRTLNKQRTDFSLFTGARHSVFAGGIYYSSKPLVDTEKK